MNRYERSGIEVIDVAVNRYGVMRAQFKLIIFVAVACGLLAAGGLYLMSIYFALSCVTFILMAIALPLAVKATVGARLELKKKAIGEVAQAEIEDLPDALTSNLPDQAIENLPRIFDHAFARYVEAGVGGRVLRIGPAAEIEAVEPFAYPFEPRKLSDVKEDEGELLSNPLQLDKKSDGIFSQLKHGMHARPDMAIVAPVLVCMIVNGLFKSGPIDGFYVSLIIAPGFGAFLWLRRKGIRERQPVAVPGALIVRDSGWMGSEWKLTLLRPQDCILLIYKRETGIWRLRLHDMVREHKFDLTHAQMTFVLRAWLSPLPPPSIEQLSDLR